MATKRKGRVPNYDVSELVRLIVMLRVVESEFLMRFLSNPRNLDRMLDLLQDDLVASMGFVQSPEDTCPMGTRHGDRCLCVIKQLYDIDYFGTRMADWRMRQLGLTKAQLDPPGPGTDRGRDPRDPR